MHNIPIIAIDGPSASGKGTVAEILAKKLGFHYLDSGALYRIVAFAAKQNNIAWDNAVALSQYAQTLHIKFTGTLVLLNNEDVSSEIRTEEMGVGASQVAVHSALRAALVNMQHQFCKAPGLVADGRDMGTVIFPKAILKVFLSASTEVRAERRYQQLLGKNQPAHYEYILQDLTQRDERDKNRTSAPLIMADDAIFIETDNLSVSDAVEKILWHFQLKMSN